MNRALAIMLFILSISVGIAILINPKPASVAVHKSFEYTNRLIHLMPVRGDVKPAQPQNLKESIPAIQQHSVTRLVSTVHTSAISTTNSDGKPAENTAPLVSTPSAATDNMPVANNAVVIDNDELDVKPRFLGGAQEWSKFLEMNLRYPAEARQARISGIVWISFIVERNGVLSNIVIERSAGHGFDEEALRVLKQSPVWTPGEENGQTVRVKYSLPINFHIVR